MKENIILEIFNRAFKDATSLSINLLEDRMIKLKIDNQDLALIETLSNEELDEMAGKIREENMELLETLSSSKENKDDIESQILDNFFVEIVSTIDRVYNLIISKQLGG
ncbi:MAG: hypothetical protein VX343_02290 [Thermodesulfobacteriota bacterium]|nr:hypothetical protein [Thermodesulfobacteriota bacterium]|tara:strand:- start:1 stop:327 length:327 start_codon:yes stop_codon:yes gene_type:complete